MAGSFKQQTGGIMGPDFGFVVLLILAVAAVPLVLLGLLITVLRRQGRDYDDLSLRLNRIERTADRTQELVKKLREAPPEVPQAKAARGGAAAEAGAGGNRVADGSDRSAGGYGRAVGAAAVAGRRRFGRLRAPKGTVPFSLKRRLGQSPPPIGKLGRSPRRSRAASRRPPKKCCARFGAGSSWARTKCPRASRWNTPSPATGCCASAC